MSHEQLIYNYSKMFNSITTRIISLTLLFNLVLSHTIDLAAATKDCYFEDLHAEDQVCYFFLNPRSRD